MVCLSFCVYILCSCVVFLFFFSVLMSCWCVCAAGHTALMRTQTNLDAHMKSCVIMMSGMYVSLD